MTIQVTAHRGSRKHAEHIDEIADAARQLVTRKVGPVGHVELMVTTTAGLLDLATRSERRVVGGRARGNGSRDPAGCGRTVLAPSGVLLLVNSDAHFRAAQLEVTVVHELVHAAQFARPGRRAELLAGLRHNYRIEDLSEDAVRAANARRVRDESEARQHERLARKLR